MILKKANKKDKEQIWQILQDAIAQRKADGSEQWQDGYPNTQTVLTDIKNGHGYVLIQNENIIGYAAIIFDVEPAYENIIGKWLTNQPYLVIHRMAVAKEAKGKGVATFIMKKIEAMAMRKGTRSIKVDTNFDNIPMLKILDKLSYTYCGEVYFRGSPRRAYEKIIN